MPDLCPRVSQAPRTDRDRQWGKQQVPRRFQKECTVLNRRGGLAQEKGFREQMCMQGRARLVTGSCAGTAGTLVGVRRCLRRVGALVSQVRAWQVQSRCAGHMWTGRVECIWAGARAA